MLSSFVLVAAVTIPPYPGAATLCSQHVTGAPSGGKPGPHISWTAFHTADAADAVVRWYTSRLPADAHRREGRVDVWRMPADRPEAVVSVTTVADAPPPVASCEERPPATARTIILISAMARPAAASADQPSTIRRSVPAKGIAQVVLRAADANGAAVSTARGATSIEIAAVPTGVEVTREWRELTGDGKPDLH